MSIFWLLSINIPSVVLPVPCLTHLCPFFFQFGISKCTLYNYCQCLNINWVIIFGWLRFKDPKEFSKHDVHNSNLIWWHHTKALINSRIRLLIVKIVCDNFLNQHVFCNLWMYISSLQQIPMLKTNSNPTIDMFMLRDSACSHQQAVLCSCRHINTNHSSDTQEENKFKYIWVKYRRVQIIRPQRDKP